MPEISRFLGVVISMYFDEHNPPHFHVKYNEFRAVLSIRECNVLEGVLPEESASSSQSGLNCIKPNCCQCGTARFSIKWILWFKKDELH